MTTSTRRRIGAGIAVGAAALLAASAVAMANPLTSASGSDDPAPTPSASSSAAPRQPDGQLQQQGQPQAPDPDGSGAPQGCQDTDGGHRGGPQGGPGGPHGTPLTGDDASKVEAAAIAAVPGGTVVVAMAENDGTYEALVRTGDGIMKKVTLDANLTVTSVEELPARGDADEDGLGGPQGQNGAPAPNGSQAPSDDDNSTGGSGSSISTTGLFS